MLNRVNVFWDVDHRGHLRKYKMWNVHNDTITVKCYYAEVASFTFNGRVYDIIGVTHLYAKRS